MIAVARPLLFVTALLLPLYASCAKPETQKFIDTDAAQRFEDQSAAIRQEMAAGGRFEFVTPDERSQVNARLEQINAILARANGQLDDDDRLDLYEAQENANAILTRRDGRRLICEYSAPTGSNRKVKQCATFADRQRAHQETQRTMFENRGKSPHEMCLDPTKC